MDECTNGSHDCGMNANCTNTEGSFTCQCITGYYGDGYNCTGEFHSQIRCIKYIVLLNVSLKPVP